ncbi:hypothetical protein MMC19_004097 [Ptychographa xylographoides]|nr:hypothetical protein [Ptychographa xylographoides]
MIFEVEVVFPHENPKIKTLFMRKVVEPIDENELLQIIEMYLVPEAPDKSARTGADFPGNHFADGHFADDHRPAAGLGDPRAAVIAGTYATSADESAENQSDGSNGGSILPINILSDVAVNSGKKILDKAFEQAMQAIVAEQVGALLLVPLSAITSEK